MHILGFFGDKSTESRRIAFSNHLLRNSSELFGPTTKTKSFLIGDELKEVCSLFFGISKETLSEPEALTEINNNSLPISLSLPINSEAMKNITYRGWRDLPASPDKVTVKQLLTNLSVVFNQIKENSNIEACLTTIRNSKIDIAIIPNITSISDALALHNKGVKIITVKPCECSYVFDGEIDSNEQPKYLQTVKLDNTLKAWGWILG